MTDYMSRLLSCCSVQAFSATFSCTETRLVQRQPLGSAAGRSCRATVGGAFLAAFWLVLSLVGLYCPVPAWAWSFHTHRKMAMDALRTLPEEMRAPLLPFRDSLMTGATDPDMVLKDFQNHVLHVNSRKETALDNLEELFLNLVQAFAKDIPASEQAYKMGLASHYIADLHQPLHTAGRDEDPKESEYHSDFEREVDRNLTRFSHGPVVYEPMHDPRSSLRHAAREAFKSYHAIGRAYRQGNRLEDLSDMVSTQYQAGVAAIRDFWLGAWQKAGKTIPVFSQAAPEIAVGSVKRSMSTPTSGAIASPGTGAHKINLNTASLEALQSLPGIGQKRAQSIIKARPFRSIYELAKIKGISAYLVERLSSLITTE